MKLTALERHAIRKNKNQRDELARTAMHGILTACSSPQYYDRISKAATGNCEQLYHTIARDSYKLADAMIAEGKKQ